MRLSLIIALFFFSIQGHAQYWIDIKPGDRNDEKPSLEDYQKQFEKYWKDKEIDNGYYFENGKRKKANGWKQFKRWENYWETRVDPETGVFPNSEMYRKAKQQFSSFRRSEEGDWMNLGPNESEGGYAGVGRINQIAFHPDDQNTFWITSPQGGAWRTTDGGNSWEVMTDNEDIMAATCIVPDPDFSDNQILYLGTGDRDSHRHDSGIANSIRLAPLSYSFITTSTS